MGKLFKRQPPQLSDKQTRSVRLPFSKTKPSIPTTNSLTHFQHQVGSPLLPQRCIESTFLVRRSESQLFRLLFSLYATSFKPKIKGNLSRANNMAISFYISSQLPLEDRSKVTQNVFFYCTKTRDKLQNLFGTN